MRRMLRGLAGVVALAASSAAQSDLGMELNDRGIAAGRRGDRAEAERLYGEALRIFRAGGPQFEPHVAAVLVNLGESLCASGKPAEAVPLYEEALAANRRVLGPKHIRSLNNMNVLATAYLLLGENDSADALLNEALAAERELYPNDMELVHTLAGLATLRSRRGQPAEALPLAQEALSLALRVAGEESVDAALMYANVAEVHRQAGRPERALPLYRKSRAICERTLGAQHPRVASILSQEGIALMEDGKLSMAEAEMTRADDLLARYCQGCLAERALSSHNLGLLRIRQQRYAEADRLLTGALAMEERASARPGRDMANTLEMLALVREKQKRHEDAVLLKSRASVILAYR